MKNYYEQIKEKITAQEVLKKYLGEPQRVTGNSALYSSPFREGDTEPSFSATDRWIKDFGGDFSGDIISFVSKLKGISIYESLNLLIKDFGLDIRGVSQNENMKVKEKRVKKEIKEIVIVKGIETKAILNMFDTVSFPSKPTSSSIGGIKNRIENSNMSTYSLEEIQNKIIQGYTSIPSGIKGDVNKNWKNQQIFMIDIDNVIKVDNKQEKINFSDSRHVTLEKVIKHCTETNLLPTFIYYTFSHTEEQHKMRLVYVFEAPITNIEIAKKIYSILLNKLKILNIDELPTNLESMFLRWQKNSI